jgi:hypothetical protein
MKTALVIALTDCRSNQEYKRLLGCYHLTGTLTSQLAPDGFYSVKFNNGLILSIHKEALGID